MQYKLLRSIKNLKIFHKIFSYFQSQNEVVCSKWDWNTANTVFSWCFLTWQRETDFISEYLSINIPRQTDIYIYIYVSMGINHLVDARLIHCCKQHSQSLNILLAHQMDQMAPIAALGTMLRCVAHVGDALNDYEELCWPMANSWIN